MIIAILHAEKQIQVNDLTRFDASKSILVKGSAGAINSVKVKPGADAAQIEIFNAQPKNWYVDFAFNAYKFDVDSTNNQVTFSYQNVQYTGLVASGTYNLTDLLAAIKAAMEAAVMGLTVTLSVDERNRVTLAASSLVKLYPKFTPKEIFQHLGFSQEGQSTGAPVEYGIRKVSLTVASDAPESATIDLYLEVYTEQGDALFSEDSDLVGFENDIMKWLPNGRGSYKDLHRKAQRSIIDWLDRQGYRDDAGLKLTKWAFIDNSDVRMWSTYLCLKLFFMGVQNQTDDVFKKKAAYYEKLEIESRDRAILELDMDGDGKKDTSSGPDIRSGRLYFR